MNIEIIMQHGWGFDRTFFAGWAGALEQMPWPRGYRLKITLPDRGYFGPTVPLKPEISQRDIADSSPSDDILIVVAHSLGLHFIPSAILAKATFLVSVCSFLNFHKDAPSGERRSRLVVGRMLTRLKKDPLSVLQDFHRLTAPSLDHAFTNTDVSLDSLARLAEDLHLLDQLDATECTELLGMRSRAIVVHGLEDKLISEQQMLALAKHLDAETFVCRAGHDLPLSRQDACTDLIARLIESAVQVRRKPCLIR